VPDQVAIELVYLTRYDSTDSNVGKTLEWYGIHSIHSKRGKHNKHDKHWSTAVKADMDQAEKLSLTLPGR